MIVGRKVRADVEPWLNEWSFSQLEVDGISKGLIIAWGPSLLAIP